MSKTTIIKGPLPGEAVEAFRQSHGGALPYELQPCPFCGQDESAYAKERDALHVVKCLHCGSRSPATMTQDGARTVWNSRHPYVNSEAEEAVLEVAAYYGKGAVPVFRGWYEKWAPLIARLRKERGKPTGAAGRITGEQ